MNAKTWVAMGVVLLGVLLSPVGAGLIVTAENDFFIDSDDDYSHGTEIEWAGDPVDHGGYIGRTGYGFNQLMFTPMEISNPYMPPMTDRPWCGTLSVYREDWRVTQEHEIRIRYELGVLGPDSYSENSQSVVHKWLDCTKPMGWDHQMPDEPMVNVYVDRYVTLLDIESDSRFGMDLKGLFGGTLGTTYDNLRVGADVRGGYNIPNMSLPGGIAPKEIRGVHKFFLYGTAGVQDSLVLHNATIGSSIIRDREFGQERDLVLLVPEASYGFVIGYGKLSLSYTLHHRGKEFEGQDDGNMAWAMLRIEFVSHFF